MNNSISLVEKCMRILCENVGVIEAEQFIYFIKTENFDYTQWQRMHYDAISEEDLQKSVDEYSKTHTFHGKKAQIL